MQENGAAAALRNLSNSTYTTASNLDDTKAPLLIIAALNTLVCRTLVFKTLLFSHAA